MNSGEYKVGSVPAKGLEEGPPPADGWGDWRDMINECLNRLCTDVQER